MKHVVLGKGRRQLTALIMETRRQKLELSLLSQTVAVSSKEGLAAATIQRAWRKFASRQRFIRVVTAAVAHAPRSLARATSAVRDHPVSAAVDLMSSLTRDTGLP